LAYHQDQDVLQAVIACLDVLLAEDPQADEVRGSWEQEPGIPWGVAAFEVELLQSADTYPIKEMNSHLIKEKYNNKETDIKELKINRKLIQRMPSSRMLCHVALVRSDASDEWPPSLG
jgi:hypothetical protein